MSSQAETLSSHHYCSQEVFDQEREHLFHGGWFMCARGDTIAPGSRRVVDVVGESIILSRTADGILHAHANVCRHRGARLCQPETVSSHRTIVCPYHAWSYALDGALVGTPHLSHDDVDRDALSLWSIALREHEGFVFVSLAKTPPAFDSWMQTHGGEVVPLFRFGLGDLRVAFTSRTTVAANWKIIVENYQECLHCTRVHPELVELVPAYRGGEVYERTRGDGGVTLSGGGNSFSHTGHSKLPLLPKMSEVDAHSYFGCTLFPNVFVDITGTSAIVSTLFPISATQTVVTMEYLFAPEAIAASGFDPQPIIDFSELVGAQDNMVCEGVQQGVSSHAFTHGVLTDKDSLVIGFVEHYNQAMSAAPMAQ